MKKYSLLHINIQKRKHIDKINTILAEKKSDFVCMQEIGSKDVESFAGRFGYEYIHSSKFFSKGSRQGQGQAILSKIKITNVKKQRYGMGNTISVPAFFLKVFQKNKPKRPIEQFLFKETLLSGEVVLDTKKITLATTHFPVADVTSPGLEDHHLYDIDSLHYVQGTREEFDELIKKIRNIQETLIFTADLNNPRGQYVYDALAHELVDQVPEKIESSIDPNLHRVKDLKLMVDTIMTTPDVNIEKFEVIEGISDHKGFFIEFTV